MQRLRLALDMNSVADHSPKQLTSNNRARTTLTQPNHEAPTPWDQEITMLPVTIHWSADKSHSGKGLYVFESASQTKPVFYVGLSSRDVSTRVGSRAGRRMVRCGVLSLGGNRRVSPRILADVERALIHALQPRKNINKKNYGPAQPMKIQNRGERGALPKVIRYDAEYQFERPVIVHRGTRQPSKSVSHDCCGARTLAGTPCRRPAATGNRRCMRHFGRHPMKS